MEGNMFWNMVDMSLTCMPSDPKLLRMSNGWWLNCCSCILCFFRDETTSLTRQYWRKKKIEVLIKEGKGSKVKMTHTVWERQCVYFEKHHFTINFWSIIIWTHLFSTMLYQRVKTCYLEDSEMQHGTFGKSSKPLQEQETFSWMSSSMDLTWCNCDAGGLTMLILVVVLLKIMKCVTPSGPAIATKSFSTFFFLTWTHRSDTATQLRCYKYTLKISQKNNSWYLSVS